MTPPLWYSWLHLIGAGRLGRPKTTPAAPRDRCVVVETGVDPVTFRFSGGRSAD